jgi:cytochrome P450
MTTTETTPSKPLPPGNLGLPWVGETLSFLRDRDFSSKRHHRYGSIFKSHIFGKPTVFIYSADANQYIFTQEHQHFVATWPHSTRTLLGPASLATNSGAFHQGRRRLMFQAFQPRALASYVPTMERITREYLQKWARMGTLTWYPELRNYTFDVASTLLVGTDGGSQTRLAHLFEQWCEGLFSLPISLPWTRFGKALKARDGMLEQIEAIVEKRLAAEDPGNDALGILIQARDEEGNGLSLDELKDQVLLLLFAGHETLTSAIASFCKLMAQHPTVRDRVRQEQDRWGEIPELAIDDLKQMTYLEQVLKEVLRFVPPVGGGFRECIEPCEFQGYSIPKNWLVLYQIGRTHYDASIYPNPETFDPDRFSPEREQERKQLFGYIPFGGGLRECLGKEFAKLEMRIFGALLCRDYDWELLPDRDLELVAVPTPHPRDGLKVSIIPRGV